MCTFSCHYVWGYIWTSATLCVCICTFIAAQCSCVLVPFIDRLCSERKQREPLNWQCTFGVRVHILWTIAQQKRDDCMIRPRQAILCLFEEEGAPSSPEQVFLRLSSPPAPRAPIATVSWWKFLKKSVRCSIKFPSYSWHIFSSSDRTDTQVTGRLCKRPPVNLP